MVRKKKILDGHKKRGSKFIPPMMQIFDWTEISYVNQILPEIIWMGLINEEFGYRDGIEISSKLAQLAFDVKETDQHINFALVSNFNLLSNDKKYQLVQKLENSSELRKYRKALLPLIALYEGFPLSFIGTNEEEFNKLHLVESIKNCIKEHIDKYKTPALIIQANIVYIRGTNGGLHIASDIEMPDLNSLLESPESEQAERAGSFVRTGAMQEFMPMGEERLGAWSKSFWNQGYKIDMCEFI